MAIYDIRVGVDRINTLPAPPRVLVLSEPSTGTSLSQFSYAPIRSNWPVKGNVLFLSNSRVNYLGISFFGPIIALEEGFLGGWVGSILKYSGR
jgi:hypothetical protein